jgi:hypothetical protein
MIMKNLLRILITNPVVLSILAVLSAYGIGNIIKGNAFFLNQAIVGWAIFITALLMVAMVFLGRRAGYQLFVSLLVVGTIAMITSHVVVVLVVGAVTLLLYGLSQTKMLKEITLG